MSTIVLPTVRPAHDQTSPDRPAHEQPAPDGTARDRSGHAAPGLVTAGPTSDAQAPSSATEIPIEEAHAPVGTALALSHDDPDLGASTAEYAVIVLAAAAFGGVMAAVLSSDTVSGLLLGIIQKALSF